MTRDPPPEPPDAGTQLTVDPETVCRVVAMARQYDVKVAPVILDRGSDPVDDGYREVLEARDSDSVAEALAGALGALNEDEIVDLLALCWIGRGDYAAAEWEAALAEARSRLNHPVRYLMGIPLLGDYLENGLSELGYSCADFDLSHL